VKNLGTSRETLANWRMSGIFWMRSAGFPADWLQTCCYTGDIANGVALSDWFETSLGPLRKSCLDLVRDELLSEAIGLSNPDALDRIESLAKTDPLVLNARNRQRMRLYWMYLQRLCAKNDTCSYFGPISWGRVASGDEADCYEVQDTLPNGDRRIFFEHWFVQKLADILSCEPGVRQILPLALNPGIRIEGQTLRLPVDKVVPLARIQLDTLLRIERHQACGTPLTLKDLKNDSFVEKMVTKGVIIAQVVVPTVQKYPLKWLIDYLSKLDDGQEKGLWITRLSQLDVARKNAECHFGKSRADILAKAAEGASAWGVDLVRKTGNMYVGRFPTYEDACRRVFLNLSRDTAKRLEKDLSPLLKAYSRLVDRVAADLDDAYAAILSGFSRLQPTGFISFLQRLARAEDILTNIQGKQQAMLETHWSRVDTFVNQHRGCETCDKSPFEVVFTPEGLDLFFETLPASPKLVPALQWRHVHSPDILLMAQNAAAVHAGNFLAVIGETHPGTYTVGQHVAAPFRSQNDESVVLEDLSQLLCSPAIMMCDPAETYQRSNINLPRCPQLFELVLPGQASRLPIEQTIPAADCEVEIGANCVELVVPNRGFRVPLLNVMPGHLHKLVFGLARQLSGCSQPKRLRVGRAIFKRRTWELQVCELPFVKRPGEDATCFAKIVNWAGKMGLPRFVFVTFPQEPKPIYVDFRNPLAVDAFCKLCSGSTTFSASEMLPAPTDLLFSDPRGKFTSEFRTSFIASKDHQ
jgi:hypothetical protein